MYRPLKLGEVIYETFDVAALKVHLSPFAFTHSVQFLMYMNCIDMNNIIKMQFACHNEFDFQKEFHKYSQNYAHNLYSTRKKSSAK